jgi:uncharacterized protein (DUF2336 family)
MGAGLGLTAQDLGSMTRLSQLAADPQGARRGDIYLAIASLYQSQAPQLSERERGLMREILQRLAGDVEMAIRIALAERLADDDAAPTDLILLLADDRIEVARPVILRSRRLSDAELLSFLDHADEAHQTACAERPHIGEPVTEHLARTGSESVLVALVRNATARIALETFTALVEKSREMAALQGPLAHRSDLPQPLAERMCEWVADALKLHIRTSHPASAPTTESKVEEAARSIHSAPAVGPEEPSPGSVKLVEKLAAAGQLRAGFLLRVLHQGQVELFETAFAKLLQLELPQLRRVLYEAGAAPVALACRAVGIDRCVFSTVFNLSRQARGRHPVLSAQEKDEVEGIFRNFTKAEALGRVRNFGVILA